MNWQPISTAPKDGTRILVWNGSYASAVVYAHNLYKNEDGWWLEDDGEQWDAFLYSEPTHWMPMPNPPKE